MAAEAKQDTQPLAKPSKISEDMEFEEMSESYKVKGKSSKQINCIKDDCKVPTETVKKASNTNKDSNAKKKDSNTKVESGVAEETFESTENKGGAQKPVTVKQGTAITDLNVYNKKDGDKKEDK